MPVRKTFYYWLPVLSIIAGLLYSSWPLGYWLNAKVAKTSLASGLEAVGQPYNWLFIATDIASSILVIIVVLSLWHKYRKSKVVLPFNISLLCIVSFAIGTIADALLPEHCVPNLMQCPSYAQDRFLLVHGIFSIIASVFLFISLCVLRLYRRQKHLLDILLVGYILFGMISIVQAVTPGNNGNWSENYYITLCSVWIVCMPYAVSLLANRSHNKLAPSKVRVK